MDLDHIRKLQHEYTGRYVVVDTHLAELRRFDGLTGFVKTVNMNGRALVQFDGRNDMGWYDIDIDYLKVVDPPPAKEAVKPAKSKGEPAAPKGEPTA
jgi:hypothetical protein